MTAINRILVPVDFSAHSDRAIEYTLTMGKHFGACVELFHVVEDPFESGGWDLRSTCRTSTVSNNEPSTRQRRAWSAAAQRCRPEVSRWSRRCGWVTSRTPLSSTPKTIQANLVIMGTQDAPGSRTSSSAASPNVSFAWRHARYLTVGLEKSNKAHAAA